MTNPHQFPRGAAMPPFMFPTSAVLRERVRPMIQQLQARQENEMSTDDADMLADLTMELITMHVAGQMPPDCAADFDNLLAGNPLIRAAYREVVTAWRAPNSEPEVTPAEVDAAWTEFRAKAGLPPSR